MLTFEQIKELIELIAKHRLSGFEMERSGFRLKVEGEADTRAPAASAAPLPMNYAVPAPPPVAVASPAPAPAMAPTTPAAAEPEEVAADSGIPSDAHILKSPIVGTFYSASSPDADPYVSVGDRVKKGQVLCIVEAMKLMNEIESDTDGEIVHVFRDNAQPVEYDEPLFAILPR